MVYKAKKVIRYRVKDVGRKGHHYLLIKVHKGKGKRGGTTKDELVEYKKSHKRGESLFKE